MKKGAFYSSSYRARMVAQHAAEEPPPPRPIKVFWDTRVKHHEKKLYLLASVLSAFVVVGLYALLIPHPRVYTQQDIDLAVQSSLVNMPPGPSAASRAYAVIRPSVVRVSQLEKEKDSEELAVKGIGTGVII